MPMLQPLSKTPVSSRERGAKSRNQAQPVGEVERSDSRPQCAVAGAAGATAVGLRSSNEDYFSVVNLPRKSNTEIGDTDPAPEPQGEYWLLAVADGMGGGRSGSHASQHAIEAFTSSVMREFPCPKNNAISPLALQHFADSALGACKAALANQPSEARQGALSGTTLTSGVIASSFLYLFHIGDSRCYLQRGLRLKQLTSDHSLYAELIRSGLPADGGEQSDATLASEHGAIFDTSVEKLEPGDMLVFCTDGVSRTLSDDAMLALLVESAAESAETMANHLVETALNQGATDNATAVVVKL